MTHPRYDNGNTISAAFEVLHAGYHLYHPRARVRNTLPPQISPLTTHPPPPKKHHPPLTPSHSIPSISKYHLHTSITRHPHQRKLKKPERNPLNPSLPPCPRLTRTITNHIHRPGQRPPEPAHRRRDREGQASDEKRDHGGGVVLGEVGMRALRAVECECCVEGGQSVLCS